MNTLLHYSRPYTWRPPPSNPAAWCFMPCFCPACPSLYIAQGKKTQDKKQLEKEHDALDLAVLLMILQQTASMTHTASNMLGTFQRTRSCSRTPRFLVAPSCSFAQEEIELSQQKRKEDRLRRKRKKEAKEAKDDASPVLAVGERVEYLPGADMPSRLIGICRP